MAVLPPLLTDGFCQCALTNLPAADSDAPRAASAAQGLAAQHTNPALAAAHPRSCRKAPDVLIPAYRPLCKAQLCAGSGRGCAAPRPPGAAEEKCTRSGDIQGCPGPGVLCTLWALGSHSHPLGLRWDRQHSQPDKHQQQAPSLSHAIPGPEEDAGCPVSHCTPGSHLLLSTASPWPGQHALTALHADCRHTGRKRPLAAFTHKAFARSLI